MFGFKSAKMVEILNSNNETKEEKIFDYITETEVKTGKREQLVINDFSEQLVKEWKYSKKQIQTRPQFRVKISPSGKEKYPVDIVVFKSNEKSYDNVYMIIECKQPTRKDGKTQLNTYLNLVPSAEFGIWYNGKEHLYLHKTLNSKTGLVEWIEIPDIPKFGEKLEDIGQYKRRQLEKPSGLKNKFADIRNYLAGNAIGITNDLDFAQQIINMLFCKIYDEIHTGLDEKVDFRAGAEEKPIVVKNRIVSIFNKVKREYEDVFESSDVIKFDPDSIVYVVGELQKYAIVEAERDAIGDAFEVFIGPALRGSEGQFFTPRNIVKLAVEIIDPNINEKIIDPSCGSGGFLIVALQHLWKKIEDEGRNKGWGQELTFQQKKDTASKAISGIDKDGFLTKVSKAYMAIVGDGRGKIFCENSLLEPVEWSGKTQVSINLQQYDIVLTNPPFGSKIKIDSPRTLKQYHLGHKWKKVDETWNESTTLDKSKPPQVLFIERCLQLLKQNGRMAIILPEGIFGNPSDSYILKYLFDNTQIIASISLAQETFLPEAHAKTTVLFLEKKIPEVDYEIFMAIATKIGHDKDGKPLYLTDRVGKPRLNEKGEKIIDDDVPAIIENYKKYKEHGSLTYSKFGFIIKKSNLIDNILIPHYYDPETKMMIDREGEKYNFISIQSLIEGNIINIKRGNEIGSNVYGLGEIPFIRTTDLINWELQNDPLHCVPEEVYDLYKRKQDLKEEDILFVNEGTYFIGRVSMLTDIDIKVIIQSHIRRIRVVEKDKMDPYLLFWSLNKAVTRKQIDDKTFMQATLPSLGNRLKEIFIPIPKDPNERKSISAEIKDIICKKRELKQKIMSFYKNETIKLSSGRF
jgi:type I restriction enzyme M protein